MNLFILGAEVLCIPKLTGTSYKALIFLISYWPFNWAEKNKLIFFNASSSVEDNNFWLLEFLGCALCQLSFFREAEDPSVKESAVPNYR